MGTSEREENHKNRAHGDIGQARHVKEQREQGLKTLKIKNKKGRRIPRLTAQLKRSTSLLQDIETSDERWCST